jgi:hypothetical protein
MPLNSSSTRLAQAVLIPSESMKQCTDFPVETTDTEYIGEDVAHNSTYFSSSIASIPVFSSKIIIPKYTVMTLDWSVRKIVKVRADEYEGQSRWLWRLAQIEIQMVQIENKIFLGSY